VTPDPATAGRPRFDIADIVRRHRVELEAEVRLTTAQGRVLSAIALCRTAALGGHVDVCCACGYEHPAYNSCRNRHCPKCQALAQERWIAARSEQLLPTGHFHVVFTVPSELRPLAKFRPAAIYNALFRTAADTLLQLGHSRLDATVGVTMVLHTWTREMLFHPHVHAIVTAGGLALDDTRWVASSSQYLFPVKVMGALLRGKMMAALRRLHVAGELDGFDGFADPEGFDRLMARLSRTRWVVYAKKPFRRSDHVLGYLGRYTHRVAIANSRLVDVTNEAVTFRTKAGELVTVAPTEFLRRFVQHVLPDGLRKIRHYGLYASSHRDGLLGTARALISALISPAPESGPSTPLTSTPATWSEQLFTLTGRDANTCPRCGQRLEHIPVLPIARPPPIRAAA
jgi:hypothetical protein